ncbi:MAG: PEP-CTERM sorting domain-containing protein [Alphaproteobacteria bacterium]|nr:MAG: PEP-CTERM sorting domain-containing protein [Alphaproteobacteria bacterium]
MGGSQGETNMRFTHTAAIATALAASVYAIAPASAATVVVNTVAPLPTATTWGTIPGENTGGGTAAVTSTVAQSGNGSLEMRGDRTRSQLGIQYAAAITNLGALSNVTGLTFDWRIAGDSTNGLNPDLTPALRLLIQDGATRKELIWEGAYNGTYGNTARDTWYSSTTADKFYITGGNVNDGQTIAQWASQLTGATVSGFSVGVGSSASAGYHAFADNVTYSTTTGSTTYNFDVASGMGAVPEPATWTLMLVGFGGIGFAMRRRKSKITTAVTYA